MTFPFFISSIASSTLQNIKRFLKRSFKIKSGEKESPLLL